MNSDNFECIDLKDWLNRFMESRTTPMNPVVNTEGINTIAEEVLLPLLDAALKTPSLTNEQKETEFAGDLFALAMYAKNHELRSWLYSPRCVNNLTPDFLINDDQYVEVYSPSLNHGSDELLYGYGLNVNDNVYNGNFVMVEQPESRFKRLIDEVEAKSVKYKALKAIFLVHVVFNEFIHDIQSDLNQVGLSSTEHQVLLYHGQTEYEVTPSI